MLRAACPPKTLNHHFDPTKHFRGLQTNIATTISVGWTTSSLRTVDASPPSSKRPSSLVAKTSSHMGKDLNNHKQRVHVVAPRRPKGSLLEPNQILMSGKCRSLDATDQLGGQATSLLPFITVTDATPQKTLLAQSISTPTSALVSDVRTPVGSATTDAPYRLLYRGALSLPDSYLQLDGLAFSARRPATAPQDSPSCSLPRSESFTRELMYNPLALALESMSGRQSLRFKGTVRLQDVWIDDTGDVYMDIHPFATLTKIYFENILCLSPLTSSPHNTFGPKRTEVGVRVSLGDTDGPETTDIVIYGETSKMLHPPPLQLSPAATSTSPGPPPLAVRVARIMPAPRAPRPDDPTPRQPPTCLFGGTTLSDLGANKRIPPRPMLGQDRGKSNAKDKDKVEDEMLLQAREVMLHLPRSKVPANGSSKSKVKDKKASQQSQRDAIFKVPELPAKVQRNQADAGTDVFGSVEPPRVRSDNKKGKGKATVPNREDSEIGDIEVANKLVLKKLSVHRLSDAGIPRSHSEFKDIFGFVYRGAAFAFRSQMKTLHINTQAAEAIVEAHVKLYALAGSDAHDASRSQRTTLATTTEVDDTGG